MGRVCPRHCRPLVGTPVQRRTSRSHLPPTCSRAACTLASPPPGKGSRLLRSSRLWSAQSLPGNPAGPPPPRRTSRLGRVARGAAFSGGLPWPDSAREGRCWPWSPRADQPADRPGAVHHPKTASVHVSRILAKLGAAGRGEAAAIAHRLGLDNNDPILTCGLSSSLSLATSPLGEPFRASRGPRPPAAQPGRVAISTRSNALYDRCATETGVREASPMARKPAGKRAIP